MKNRDEFNDYSYDNQNSLDYEFNRYQSSDIVEANKKRKRKLFRKIAKLILSVEVAVFVLNTAAGGSIFYPKADQTNTNSSGNHSGNYYPGNNEQIDKEIYYLESEKLLAGPSWNWGTDFIVWENEYTDFTYEDGRTERFGDANPNTVGTAIYKENDAYFLYKNGAFGEPYLAGIYGGSMVYENTKWLNEWICLNTVTNNVYAKLTQDEYVERTILNPEEYGYSEILIHYKEVTRYEKMYIYEDEYSPRTFMLPNGDIKKYLAPIDGEHIEYLIETANDLYTNQMYVVVSTLVSGEYYQSIFAPINSVDFGSVRISDNATIIQKNNGIEIHFDNGTVYYCDLVS